MSRDKATYPLFDSAMVKAGSGQYESAIADLKNMPKSQVAKDILTFV